MRVSTLVVISTVFLVVAVNGCGGGRSLPDPERPDPESFAQFWGSPGGNPANTRLSNRVGPLTNEVGWTAISDISTRSNVVVTPNATVVVGTTQGVIGFNHDGSIRWRIQSSDQVAGLLMNKSGTICFQHESRVFRQIDQDGKLLLEYETEIDSHIILIGLGGDNTMYFKVVEGALNDGALVSVDGQGNSLYEIKLDDPFDRHLVLPGGLFAFTSREMSITVVDSSGNVQWSEHHEDMYVGQLFLGPNDTIYISGQISGSQEIGYFTYKLDGTGREWFEPDFQGIRYYLEGVTPEGETVWGASYDNQLAVLNPNGSIAWKYDIEETSQVRISVGSNGEILAAYDVGGASSPTHHLLGFNSAGENILVVESDTNQFFTPGVGELGEVYSGRRDKLYAYHPTGESDWSYEYGGNISSLACGSAGTVYSTGGNILYANSASGEELWRYSGSGELGTVLVSREGKVYTHTSSEFVELSHEGNLLRQVEFPNIELLEIALSADGHLYSADSSGTISAFLPGLTPSWEYALGELVTTPIAIADAGTLIFGCDNGLLYAVDLMGNELWTFDPQGLDLSAPAVTQDAVYVTSAAGGLFKLDLDGNQLWHFEPQYNCHSSPSVGADGTVYIGTSSRRFTRPTSKAVTQDNDDLVLLDLGGVGLGLYAVNPDGSEKWNLHSNQDIEDPVSVDGEGNIYLGIKGQLFSLNPDGTERWRNRRDARTNTAPLINTDGSVIYGSGNFVVSIGPGS